MKFTVQDGFPYYIELLGKADYRELFLSQENFTFLETISDEQAINRYAPNKWSIKQIIGHMTDHERIMTYRTLRFSRRDTTQLSGYDQNLLVDNSRFDELTLQQLITDFKTVRKSTIPIGNRFDQIIAVKNSNLSVGKFRQRYHSACISRLDL